MVIKKKYSLIYPLQLVILLAMLIHPGWADMAKLYIGDEEGQLIVGLEGSAVKVDQAVSANGSISSDLRYYVRKQGIVVDGNEYNGKPGKLAFTLGIQGRNSQGTMLGSSNSWVFFNNHDCGSAMAHHFSLLSGYSQGANSISDATGGAGSSCH